MLLLAVLLFVGVCHAAPQVPYQQFGNVDAVQEALDYQAMLKVALEDQPVDYQASFRRVDELPIARFAEATAGKDLDDKSSSRHRDQIRPQSYAPYPQYPQYAPSVPYAQYAPYASYYGYHGHYDDYPLYNSVAYDNRRYPHNSPYYSYAPHRPTNYIPNYYNYPARNPERYQFGSHHHPIGHGYGGGYGPGYGYGHGHGDMDRDDWDHTYPNAHYYWNGGLTYPSYGGYPHKSLKGVGKSEKVKGQQ